MMFREFWEEGFRVFGIYGADANGHCACGWDGCKPESLYKHPRVSNWQHTPLWSEEQIDAMEASDQFATGYGVLCAGLIVVDIDARNGGVASFAKLSESVPEVAGAGFVVATGSGGGSRHMYFRAPEGVPLVSHLPEYPGLDFKSSGYVIGPGSRHASGNTYLVAYGTPADIEAAPPALVELLRKPERHRATYDGGSLDVSHSDLADMLSHIDPDCDYETWIRCGMAVHDASGGTAFDVWDAWSQVGTKYPANARGLENHWHSFGRSANPVTIGTLIHYAEAGGWKMPVEFTPAVEFSQVDQPQDTPRERAGAAAADLPFSIDGIDLKSPPGLVGDIARWVGDQSRRPLENLAVAAALASIGNIAGLRYTDDRDGVTCNLFTFCVAGSRTGKESIQQAQGALHRAAGIAGATHGSIKSEQEIVRNLIRHQAALYIVDEFGYLLQKVKNAQERGGASYLEGVTGLLMAAYSKADGFMLLTGDAKEDLRDVLSKEASLIQKRLDENNERHGDSSRLEAIKRALDNLDNGLERPFLALSGYATPVTFDALVDYHSATNGFIGRALIFNDRDTSPRSKKRFRKTPLPDDMAAALMQLYGAGEYDMTSGGRVEYYGQRRVVPSTADALEMLDAALDWTEDQAIAHKGLTGLEALWLGAYELISKVSLILAAPSGLRTAEHVRWAFALVRRDVDEKMRLVVANDGDKSNAPRALLASVGNAISGDGETIGVIYNRLRKYKREDVDKALAHMVERGAAIAEPFRGRNGRESVRYRMTS